MTILDERGLFWWGGEPVPQRQFAPDSCVPGHLIIDDQGLSHLELDGAMAGGERIFFPKIGVDPSIQGKSMRGLLKGDNQRVILSELRRDGGRGSTAGLSYERFLANNCVVSDTEFLDEDDISFVGSFEVSLTGFEEWLGLRSIELTKEPNEGLSATYHKPDDLDYPLASGKLSIRHYINRPYSATARLHNLSLKEVVLLRYSFSEKLAIEGVKDEYRQLEELLILLTNSEYSLDWPSITLSSAERRYWLYFWRHRNPAAAPGLFECYPNFNLIRKAFGAIFDQWKAIRGDLGPAIYLYLGLRRGQPMYLENRFVNLIWAVETFHRIKNPEHHTLSKLIARRARILARFTDQDKADKETKEDLRWLTGRLKYLEPSLEDRIFETISSLPLGFDEKRVRRFAKSCADRRNEISHHGGQHKGGRYGDFIIDLGKKSDALEYLHHALLLQELQLGDEIVFNFIYNNYRSFRFKHALVEVGLLDDSVLKPPDMPVPKLKNRGSPMPPC